MGEIGSKMKKIYTLILIFILFPNAVFASGVNKKFEVVINLETPFEIGGKVTGNFQVKNIGESDDVAKIIFYVRGIFNRSDLFYEWENKTYENIEIATGTTEIIKFDVPIKLINNINEMTSYAIGVIITGKSGTGYEEITGYISK